MQFSLAILSLVAVAVADTTCGKNVYTDAEVKTAQDTASSYEKEGSDVDSYPHQYNNYEGFKFPIPGPWYEFPIVGADAYDGGSPGADRVIIDKSGDLAGVITHTGASGDDFVGCTGTAGTNTTKFWAHQ